MILALRTDRPEAELYLFSQQQKVASYTWLAHRELSDTLLIKIEDLLAKNQISLADLTGIAVYQGPGSFTGLRIGITAANTLSYTLGIPIAASTDEDWLYQAIDKLEGAEVAPNKIVVPEYGTQPHITSPRK